MSSYSQFLTVVNNRLAAKFVDLETLERQFESIVESHDQRVDLLESSLSEFGLRLAKKPDLWEAQRIVASFEEDVRELRDFIKQAESVPQSLRDDRAAERLLNRANKKLAEFEKQYASAQVVLDAYEQKITGATFQRLFNKVKVVFSKVVLPEGFDVEYEVESYMKADPPYVTGTIVVRDTIGDEFGSIVFGYMSTDTYWGEVENSVKSFGEVVRKGNATTPEKFALLLVQQYVAKVGGANLPSDVVEDGLESEAKTQALKALMAEVDTVFNKFSMWAASSLYRGLTYPLDKDNGRKNWKRHRDALLGALLEAFKAPEEDVLRPAMRGYGWRKQRTGSPEVNPELRKYFRSYARKFSVENLRKAVADVTTTVDQVSQNIMREIEAELRIIEEQKAKALAEEKARQEAEHKVWLEKKKEKDRQREIDNAIWEAEQRRKRDQNPNRSSYNDYSSPSYSSPNDHGYGPGRDGYSDYRDKGYTTDSYGQPLPPLGWNDN